MNKLPDFKNNLLRVEKGGEERLLKIPEFEALTGAAFIPVLDFASFSVLQDIVERTKKMHRKGELMKEQLWLGSYFRKEVESLFFPDVTIRWIDDFVGWGAFAARAFKKMEYIAEYSGKVRKRERRDKKNAYCFEYTIASGIPTPYTIDAQDQGGIGRFLNHSDHPNLLSTLVTVESIEHVILVTDRTIEKGEQLVFDYGQDYWARRKKPKDLI
jgi:SET domain-containing protein